MLSLLFFVTSVSTNHLTLFTRMGCVWWHNCALNSTVYMFVLYCGDALNMYKMMLISGWHWFIFH